MLIAYLVFLVCFFLVFGLTLAHYFLLGDTPSSHREESSTYECGFEHHSYSRVPFSIRYFMLTLIFLVFDMEIMFLLFLPGACFVSLGSWLSISCFSVFVLILLLALIYEWLDGSMDWVM